ncbi:hypothetical protein M5689_000268 [Euphorbia peplus]|nr:hypothetical protein M5689_000268 [Euphorbia peplus]
MVVTKLVRKGSNNPFHDDMRPVMVEDLQEGMATANWLEPQQHEVDQIHKIVNKKVNSAWRFDIVNFNSTEDNQEDNQCNMDGTSQSRGRVNKRHAKI